MPNVRAAGQKLVNLPMKEEAVQQLDAGAEKATEANRSQFIRDAIREKLERLSITAPKNYFIAPGRTAYYKTKSARERALAVAKKKEE